MGRFLIITGILIALAGVAYQFRDKLPFLGALGHLPGDISWRSGNTEVHVPIVTCLIISVVLSLLLRLFRL